MTRIAPADTIQYPSSGQATAVPTVERDIHFFRAITALQPDGGFTPFDAAPIVHRLAGLPPTFPGIYAEDSSGYVLAKLVEGATDRLMFARSRRVGLPSLESDGAFAPLTIPANSGLAEVAHVMFFANNVVAADFNFYAPRVPALARYLKLKCPTECPQLAFYPLLTHDVGEQLDSMHSIKWVSIRMAKPYVASLEPAVPSLYEAFDRLDEIGEAEDIEVILRPKKYSRGSLAGTVKDTIRRLLQVNNEGSGAVIEGLKVEGFSEADGQQRVLDLLSDKLVATRQMIQLDPSSKAIDPASAFAAISDAHAQLQHVAATAPSFGVGS